jgi:hypothetical protein
MTKKKIVLIALIALALSACSTVRPVEEAPVPQPVVQPRPVELDEAIIAGSAGVEIDRRELVLTVAGSLPQDITEETELNWLIENLPEGLSLTARAAKAGDSTLTVILSGIPLETRQDALVLNQSEFRISLGANYRFDIAAAAGHLIVHQYPVVEPWRRSDATESIEGIPGKAIVAKDVVLTFRDAVLKDVITEDTPITWITNLPAGLSARALRAEPGAATITVTVSGIPQETKNEALAVTIPAGALTRNIALVMAPNEDLRFEIADAAVAPVIIGGAMGSGIIEKDVVITLSGSSLYEDIAPGASLPWITNLPAGLSARAKGSKAGDSVVVITVGGTPSVTGAGILAVTIPPAALATNLELTASTDGAKYDIGDSETIRYNTQSFGITNPAWRDSRTGPAIPSHKDFEGVGIIRVTSQMVENLGPDNRYYWSGETVTYGKLMTEAQRLGAHAIINAAIESEDRVSYTKVTRYLEEGHRWTIEEQEKIQAGILKDVTIDGKRYAEETVRVTTRNYTGTALAIRYTAGLEFYEVEKLKTDAQRAETARAEADKAQADAQRAQAEADRAQADADRARAESDRAQAEASRARAEADAEAARIQAARDLVAPVSGRNR